MNFTGKHLQTLIEHLHPVKDLAGAGALLSWDQEVHMPPAGAQARANQLATLGKIGHELFISKTTGDLLQAAEEEMTGNDGDPVGRDLLRVVRRDYDHAVKIPSSFVEQEAKTVSKAFLSWKTAREKSDFAQFSDSLSDIVQLNLQKAEYLGYEDHPYDALLNQFEPGFTMKMTDSLFSKLKPELVELVRKNGEKPAPDTSFLEKNQFPEERQWEFSILVLKAMGYDFSAGRQDRSPHPFTTSFSIQDVRVTTRLSPEAPASSLLSSVHEGGHALYEQGIPVEFDRTHLASGATLGIHESQSRMWENQVARSRPFWQYFFPIYQAFFPDQLGGVNLDSFLKAFNYSRPGLIRVESDELTYNLHIFVRFELELALMKGELKAKDIPAAWNEKYESYLGLRPGNDAEGCLQDIHWSHGAIGYFPTYTIGNILAAQMFEKAKSDIPNLDGFMSMGKFQPLLEWLRKNVHEHGARFTADELIRKITGNPIDVEPLLSRFRKLVA